MRRLLLVAAVLAGWAAPAHGGGPALVAGAVEDAVQQGLTRAGKTLRHVRGAWVKEQHVRCGDDGRITEYQVNMMVTFVLDD